MCRPRDAYDKFQGQEAAVVLISMATSSGDDLPRQIEFLCSRNRLNVAISRARDGEDWPNCFGYLRRLPCGPAPSRIAAPRAPCPGACLVRQRVSLREHFGRGNPPLILIVAAQSIAHQHSTGPDAERPIVHLWCSLTIDIATFNPAHRVQRSNDFRPGFAANPSAGGSVQVQR
jgi:hypothetical protein